MVSKVVNNSKWILEIDLKQVEKILYQMIGKEHLNKKRNVGTETKCILSSFGMMTLYIHTQVERRGT